MKNLTLLIAFLCGFAAATAQKADIVPLPQHMQGQGGTFAVANTAQLLSQIDSVALKLWSQGPIRLHRDISLPNEGYTLRISDQNIEVGAREKAGYVYALQTLRQLVMMNADESGATCSLPCLFVRDYPQFDYRGLMLDCSRHFFTKEEVKKVLRMMAYYKLNRFHWHLTDDQGWRIEIPEYPRLTQVGTQRDSSFVNRGVGWFYDDTPYGKGLFYTLADLREVVDYAASLNIEIIPEIDLPGHMVAAIASYPEFSCDPSKKYSVRVAAGVSKDVLNVGDDRVIDFLKCVLSHVAEVFPGPYIHLGGDECPTDVWKNNADCQRRIAEKGLKGVDELQSWLVEELGSFLKGKYNKNIIVWDELLAHWKADNAIRPTVMCWRGLDYTAQAAEKGFSCISVPVYPCYLDLIQMPEDMAFVEEPYQGGYSAKDVNSLPSIYAVNPIEKIKGDAAQYCLGPQANLWTETCRTAEQMEYQLLPRALAIAEVGWTAPEQKNWDDFRRRLQTQASLLSQMGYVYARHYIDPTQTVAEQERNAVAALLLQNKAGQAGYASPGDYKKLKKAFDRGGLISADYEQFKQAPIVLPKAGRRYRIVSASSWYMAKYAGSTLYAKSPSELHLHFTPQSTLAEQWLCQRQGRQYVFVNVANPQVKIGPVSVEKATKPIIQPIDGEEINFVSGAIVLRDGSGRVLQANHSGCAAWGTNDTLCQQGTWRLEQIE